MKAQSIPKRDRHLSRAADLKRQSTKLADNSLLTATTSCVTILRLIMTVRFSGEDNEGATKHEK